MFLDSLVGDAAWQANMRLNRKTSPFRLTLLKKIFETHPFNVLQLRAMLSVSYFEKALYEV
jgi:hypothetical protein